MSSNINTIAANIDATFPVAGQDNPSQGFRDNFSTIKLAFSTATTEISNLQLNAVQIDQSNDFQFVGGILRTTLQNSGFAASVTGSSTLDYTQANYYQDTISATPTTFQVTKTSWPAGAAGEKIFGQLRLEVVATWPATIDFAAPSGTLRSETAQTLPYAVTSGTSTTIWDLWSIDGGTNVFVKLAGGPYA